VTQPYLGLAEARFVRAQAAAGAGDADRARSEIDRALELRPSWELAALFKAELLPKGAAQLEYLKTWLAANPDAQEVRLGYARALVGDKRYDVARVRSFVACCRPIPTTRTFFTRWGYFRCRSTTPPRRSSNSSVLSTSAAAT
jgi:predicted Zn-dependent protease